MAASADLATLLLGFAQNPGVAHLLCAYISRTGLVCKAIRSHAPGEVVFDVETWPPHPDMPRRPGVYTLHFDPSTGQPKHAQLEQVG